jgi:hypothetical protein
VDLPDERGILSAYAPAALVAAGLELTGRALGRFGTFHAGVDSAEDPRHTLEPQRERLARPTSS